MADIKLTNNESRVMEFIQEYLEKQRMYPTFREIKTHLDLSSINSISQYIRQLERKGLLEVMKHKGYRLKRERKEGEEMVNLPLIGRVQAGIPTDAGDDQENLHIPKCFVKNPGITFALRVRGNSMVNAGIQEGDIVIVEHRPKAFNGDIIVALVNNENTVKRYIRHEDGSRYLKAENPDFEDIMPEGDWSLQGVVVGLWRQY